MAAYFTVSYVRARRRFQASTPDDTLAVRRWLAGRTLCRPLEVRQSTLVSSPLTYGVLRPVMRGRTVPPREQRLRATGGFGAMWA